MSTVNESVKDLANDVKSRALLQIDTNLNR